MSDSYSLETYIEDLRRIAGEAGDEAEIFERVGPLASRLALQTDWLKPEHHEADQEQGFGVHLLHEEDDHSLAVFVICWLPGRGAPAHDHGTWAVVAGVKGNERNVRYKRLDDGKKPGHADLEIKDENTAGPGELVCVRSSGIHAVWNDSDAITVSLHTYGRHINHTGRSVFDPDEGTQKEFIVKVS